ncbi:MAG: DNA cytosine methyltransferase [Cellulomonadaceae bacterium]|nr:DNA cytosine methyltransferase [Cellulomonadaceae bacterium]
MATYAVKLERSAPLALPRHPDAPTDDKFEEWCAAEAASGRRLAVDLFSGAGGLGAGVEAAGWTVVAAVDHDKAALETHRANFRGRALEVDMSDSTQVTTLIERLRPIGIDLVAGGPPCQPFSRAGRAKIRSLVNEGVRGADDTRKELWRSFIDVVLALRPRAVVMENVPDMAIGDDLRVIREIASLLEGAGYTVDYRLLDAWKHGVPQHRKRFILQARRDGVTPVWPEQNEARPTVRHAIEDLPLLNGTTGARETRYSGSPQHALAKELRGEQTSIIYDHMTRPVRDDDREAFELMTSSTLYSDLPDRLKRYRSDTFNDKYKRLDWDDLSRTITAHIAKDGYWYIHPSEHRTLTVREAARIQTFPDHFRFSGTRSDAFRQIGNAVPPLLGRVVAESIVAAMPNPLVVADSLPAMRALLAKWAVERREEEWWLFPGSDMTPTAAAIASILDVHRLPPDIARDVIAPFRGAQTLTLSALMRVDITALSKTRRLVVRELRDALRYDSSVDLTFVIADGLGTAQRTTFSLLRGGNELYVNEHIAKVVTLLMQLPDGHRGLRTDIKVALAQLVASGSDAALRMCALRAITVSEARAQILSPARACEGPTEQERAS